MEKLLEQLHQELPAVFAGPRIDELSGGAIAWGTIQNKRSRKEIPADCFVYSGPKVLVVRDRFLDWWATQLNAAPVNAAPPIRVTRHRHAKSAAPTPEAA